MTLIVEKIARAMAILGGLVLTTLIILSSLSILGRGLNTLGHSEWLNNVAERIATSLISTGVGPIAGDFELVEAGVAFVVFAFLPICQLYGAHAKVEIFTSKLPQKLQDVLRTFWETLFAVVMVVVCWRLLDGTLNKLSYGETTFILQFPIWWAYATSFVAALIAAFVAVYCAGARCVEMLTGHNLLLRAQGVSE